MTRAVFERAIDVHTHPFTDETRMGHGPSYTEAHEYFGSSSESAHASGGHRAKSIDESYAELKEGGVVRRAVVVNMNACTTYGRALANDYIARYVREHPDLYIGFGSVDPNMPRRRAVDEVRRCKEELGLTGLKFHPAYQEFFPNDHEKAYPIYEECVRLGMPVLFHTGTTRMTRCNIRSCKPEYLDEVATDFPELRIIMSHFGWPWTEESLAVLWRHEHVYMDLSGWMPKYIYGAQPIVFQYMNTVLQDKFVFGSDYPAITPQNWLRQFRTYAEEGFEWGGSHHVLSAQTVEKFLWLNPIRALGLDPAALD